MALRLSGFHFFGTRSFTLVLPFGGGAVGVIVGRDGLLAIRKEKCTKVCLGFKCLGWGSVVKAVLSALILDFLVLLGFDDYVSEYSVEGLGKVRRFYWFVPFISLVYRMCTMGCPRSGIYANLYIYI